MHGPSDSKVCRIARRIEILYAFNFEIQHRPGNKHNHADAMSRHMDLSDVECSEPTSLACGHCKSASVEIYIHKVRKMGIPMHGAKVQAVKTRNKNAEENLWTPLTEEYKTTQLSKLQETDEHTRPILRYREEVGCHPFGHS